GFRQRKKESGLKARLSPYVDSAQRRKCHTYGAVWVDPSNVFFLLNMKILHMIAFVLAMIGALNWGLVGLGGFAGADWNVVHFILASWPQVEWLVYVLVGLSAIWLIVNHRKDCKWCSGI